MKFRHTNNLIGWMIFVLSAIVYLLTLEPTVSLWDCGEFISSAFKLQVGHPPGAPLFMIIGRFFALLAGSHTDKVAMMINAFSGVSSALTVMFLFWTITHLATRLRLGTLGPVKNPEAESTDNLPLRDKIIIIGCGLVGSLAFTFTDSFWFSAVEGEVYAFSSLFTAVVFWAILKWENVADSKYANRWLVLIAYLMGLSIGVHLLNLLAIPAIMLIYYFRMYTTTPAGVLKALVLSFIVLGTFMYLIIPGVVWLATRFELVFVNGFGLSFNSGVLIYAIMLIGGLVYGIYKTYTKRQTILNTILLMITVIIIGYSSFSMIVIRSLANPPMDENNPESVFSLLYYLNREQYGDRPFLYGQYFNAPPKELVEGKPTYTQINGRYKITSRKLSYTYHKKFTTLFPRMWSSDNQHVDAYIDWAGLKESKLFEPRRDDQNNIIRDNEGRIMYDREAPKNPPGFLSNLRFFLTYQVGHMYFRYFMWNFVGRQNDLQGHGDPLNGNWISGIKFIDQFLIGSEKNMPENMKNMPSRNTYYFLPLLLGIFGLVFLWQRDAKYFWVIMLLFVLTGLAIVIYLNQTPVQPRERDYAYTGSFYAFAIWIGLGVMALFDALNMKFRKNFAALLLTGICMIIVPGVMAYENWDDHDRSGRYTARDMAYNYLNSCAPNAILFTVGDNDTFPLWYAQEVEGIRTDVRVVNLMLLNMSWHVDQIRRKAYSSNTLPVSLSPDKYMTGSRDFVYVQERTSQSANIKDIIEFVASDLPQAKIESANGEKYNYIPTRNFILPVDTSLVLNNGTMSAKDKNLLLPAIEWRYNRNSMSKSALIVLDILANNNWERPIYFASLGHEGTLGLEEYMQLEGFAYRLVPIRSAPKSRFESGRLEQDILYQNLMQKFMWRGLNESGVYLDDFHVRTTSILRIRSRFVQLAESLISQGDTAKAVQVLDRCLFLTPHSMIPYDFTILQVADSYCKSGQDTKGIDLMRKLASICNEKLIYYLSQNRSFVSSVSDEITYNIQIIQNLSAIAQNHNFETLGREFDTLLSSHYKDYTDKLQVPR